MHALSLAFRFPETDKISPPLLQLSNVKFGYEASKIILSGIDIDVGLESRIAIVGPNGAGKSTLIKLLTGELKPLEGHMTRNGRLRMCVRYGYTGEGCSSRSRRRDTFLLHSAYFAQHHVDLLTPSMSAVSFLQSKYPGKTEQEYRQHLGAFGITGLTGCARSFPPS